NNCLSTVRKSTNCINLCPGRSRKELVRLFCFVVVFSFYSYIKPDEYRLTDKPGHRFMQLVDFRTVDKQLLLELDWQEEYNSEEAMLADAGFQLWKRGYRYTEFAEPLPSTILVENQVDNYRFIRLYFGARWAWYILFLRLQEGCNWKEEWKAFREVRNLSKIKWEKPLGQPKPIDPKKIRAPRVSVVITSLQRHTYLDQIIKDLEQQELPPWEILVVDQSPTSWVPPESAPTVRVIHTPHEQGQWTGRNWAIRESRGEYIAFLDDDVRIYPDWLQHHLRILEDWSADISTGVYVRQDETIPASHQYPHYASQWNANNSVMKSYVLEQLGPLPGHFDGTRWGDHYYGCRAFQAGMILVSNPLAVAMDRRAPQGGLREGGEPSFTAYRILGKSLPISKGVIRYFLEFFDQDSLFRWVKTKLPWQGGRGKGLMFRILYHILSFPRLRKRVLTQWNVLSEKETA
ncbi:MAG: glycosyltransferase family 2 protein, partial [Bacteroidota bacterium]